MIELDWTKVIIVALLAFGLLHAGLLVPLRRIIGYHNRKSGRYPRLAKFLTAVSLSDAAVQAPVQDGGNMDGAAGCVLLLAGTVSLALIAVDPLLILVPILIFSLFGLWVAGHHYSQKE